MVELADQSHKNRDRENAYGLVLGIATGAKGPAAESADSAAGFRGGTVFKAHYDAKCVKFMMQCVSFNGRCRHLNSNVYFNL